MVRLRTKATELVIHLVIKFSTIGNGQAEEEAKQKGGRGKVKMEGEERGGLDPKT